MPLEFVYDSQNSKYQNLLSEAADRMILSMFIKEYKSINDFFNDNETYEEIESKLLPHVRPTLIFNNIKDCHRSLRERCNQHLEDHGIILPIVKSFDEAHLFYFATLQYCMQAISIVLVMKHYCISPFIRNDVSFQYYNLIYNSNIIIDFSKEEYMKTYVPYIIQKAFDFSKDDYSYVKDNYGNGKLVDAVINAFDTNDTIPSPNMIVECVSSYMFSCAKAVARDDNASFGLI